jgi:hypothetical protein
MPATFDTSAGLHNENTTHLEDEVLGMPSDLAGDVEFPQAYIPVANLEMRLREAEVMEALNGVRKMVKIIGATWHEKNIHARGFQQNTRTNTHLDDLMRRRDLFMETYNCARGAIQKLKQLGVEGPLSDLPPLTLKDTVRKPPQVRRMVGQSRYIDGALWSGKKISPIKANEPSGAHGTCTSTSADADGSALTVSTKRQSRESTLTNRSRYPTNHDSGTAKKSKVLTTDHPDVQSDEQSKSGDDGWIWSSSGTSGLGVELAKWEEEGKTYIHSHRLTSKTHLVARRPRTLV